MVNYSLTDSISIVCWVYSQPPIMGLSFGQEQLILKRHVWKEVFHFDSRKNIHQQPVTVYVKEPRPLGNKTDDGSNSNKRTGASTTARRYQNKNSIEQFQLSCTSSPVAANGSSFVPRDVQWSWTMSNGTGLQFNASQPLYGTPYQIPINKFALDLLIVELKVWKCIHCLAWWWFSVVDRAPVHPFKCSCGVTSRQQRKDSTRWQHLIPPMTSQHQWTTPQQEVFRLLFEAVESRWFTTAAIRSSLSAAAAAALSRIIK